MIRIPISSIASLLSLHKFKTRKETINELNLKNENRILYEKKRKATNVQRELFKLPFYKKYCESTYIDSRMRVEGRRLVNEACSLFNVRFNKPYTYWAKQRGIYRENYNTDRAANIMKVAVIDRQLKVSRKTKYFEFIGAIDGRTRSGKIVEIKTRSSPVEISIFEQIQLIFYVWALSAPSGVIFSFYGNGWTTWEITLNEVNKKVEQYLLELNDLTSPSGSLQDKLPRFRTTNLMSRKAQPQNADTP